MSIQWYPGHMHKARKQIQENLARVDLIIEVLDARLPHSSENPLVSRLRGDKPCIKVLSKSDLADPETTAQWQHYLGVEKGVKTLAITTEQPAHMRQLPELCRKLAPGKAKSQRTINAMILGIPNAGKSTLINTLVGKSAAKVGNEPAVTKNQQRIKVDDQLILWDTPGMLWPKIENPNSGYRLASTGAIKVTAMDFEDVAFFAAEYLLKAYPENLRARFQLPQMPASELELLESIARRRGGLRPGGRVNLHKAAEVLLTELRSGALGKVSLETPAVIVAEQALLATQRQQDPTPKKNNTR